MGDASGAGAVGETRSVVAERAGRLDAVLAAVWPDLSRARIQRLVSQGGVLLNGEPARKSASVRPGDSLSASFPEHEHAPGVPGIAIPVLYEDAEVAAIDKPPGLATHGAPGDTGPSVAAWFLDRYPQAARAFDADRPGIVHRLDKDTSGVLILAKTPAAGARLGAVFEGRLVDKLYLAVCDGVPGRPRAMIDAPIERHPGDRTRMTIAKGGRGARTEYEVLGAGADRSLLLVRLYTGRTHQIRVHLAAIGHPVAGDVVYGRRTRPAEVAHQLLHAWRLRVPHPAGGTLTVTAAASPDVTAAVRAMGLDGLALEYGAAIPAVLDRSARIEHPGPQR